MNPDLMPRISRFLIVASSGTIILVVHAFHARIGRNAALRTGIDLVGLCFALSLTCLIYVQRLGRPGLTALVIVIFICSGSIFHYLIDHLTRRRNVLAQLSRGFGVFTYAIGAVGVFFGGMCAYLGIMGSLATIASVFQIHAYLMLFMKFIFAGLGLFGVRFVNFGIRKNPPETDALPIP
jgi:hypothetical protein